MGVIKFSGTILSILIIYIIITKIWMNIANLIGEKLQISKIITRIRKK